MALRPCSASKLEGGIASAAADIDELRTGPDLQSRKRDLAVMAEALHEDVAKPLELLDEDLVPEVHVLVLARPDSVACLCHRYRSRGAPATAPRRIRTRASGELSGSGRWEPRARIAFRCPLDDTRWPEGTRDSGRQRARALTSFFDQHDPRERIAQARRRIPSPSHPVSRRCAGMVRKRGGGNCGSVAAASCGGFSARGVRSSTRSGIVSAGVRKIP